MPCRGQKDSNPDTEALKETPGLAIPLPAFVSQYQEVPWVLLLPLTTSFLFFFPSPLGSLRGGFQKKMWYCQYPGLAAAESS